ncbi:putative ABC transport system permease protein [Chryseolinea serpens]|uniref:Putative ABC transport system permease protein n=1 Tax=Chryseolinea serpens TaxID=947013 RepID=A0A1M5TNI7_9BACT|nr:FtsX-like permease family protein [Chryseolinea serpens]SHH52375.1 putative ABC transport system permease protein [Chryseolinea serpens]
MKTKPSVKPPRLADRLFEWYCNNASIEDLHGDLEELFFRNLEKMSVRRAKWNYWRHVLSLIFSYALRRRKQRAAFHPYAGASAQTAMLLSYLKIGFRNLVRNKSYAVVNIGGLAISGAVGLMILLFIAHERSYDRYNSKADRIYRLNFEHRFGENHAHMATTPAMAASTLQQEFPEIESTTRFLDYGTYLVRAAEAKESIKEYHVLWTDSTVFKIFSLQVLEGNANKALADPYGVAISKRTAVKYFGNASALGKSLVLDNRIHAQVTAVFEDLPAVSHFHADMLISLAGDWPAAREARFSGFSNNNFNSYILLRPGADVHSLEAKLPAFVEKYNGPSKGGDFARLELMPLLDIHLHSQLRGELETNGDITYVYLFFAVAVFVLIIACINFMNLATAQSTQRAKEVGIRKVLGSQRGHLVRQFLLESFIITGAGFTVAIGLAQLLTALFSSILQKPLQLPLTEPWFYAALGVATGVVSLLAGAYPSFVLSGFKPVSVLKGRTSLRSNGVLRSGLVVFQFVVSILLMVGAFTVNQQVAYIQNKKLGFEKDHVLLVKDAYALRPNSGVYKTEAAKIPAVRSTTVSGFIPVEGGSDFPRRDRSFWKEGTQPSSDNLVNIQQWSVDFDYITTLGLDVVDGRGFSEDFPSDSAAVVLNKTGADRFGLGSDPIGKRIATFGGGRVPDFDHPVFFTVIGVVDDFHFSSLKENIGPLALFLGKSDGFVSIRFDGDPKPVIDKLEATWKRMAPGQPFQYSFLDQEYGRMYAGEQRLAKLFGIFAAFAVIIACIGLFALTAYTSQQRTKEIGIRKVLGASVASIVFLLSGEFTKLIVIAFVVAAPLAWVGVRWWLENFTYKVDIGLMVYAAAGLLVLVIAWLTTWYHSFRAASADPVKSIRTE